MATDQPIPTETIACSNPFFIIGSGRAGSTLLRLILNRHPNLCIPPETWFLLPLAERFVFDAQLNQREVEEACELMTGHRRWPDFKIDAAEFQNRVYDNGVNTIQGLTDVFFGIHCVRANKPRWGDKTPPYIHITPQLLRLYPQARFIYLVRDGRDVANSFIDTRWHGPGAYANSQEWIKAVRSFAALVKEPEVNSRMLRVIYEDLVENTERVTKEICQFLGENYFPSMVIWPEQENSVVPQRESHAHTKLSRKPQASDLYRWETSQSKIRVFLLEAYMRNELQTEGYRLRYKSRYWAPIRSVIRLFAPIGARIYRSIIWRVRNAGQRIPRRNQ